MTNTNIQAPVPFDKGLFYKPRGSYERGELSKLVNMEVHSDGVIRTRREIVKSPVGVITHGSGVKYFDVNPYGFIGETNTGHAVAVSPLNMTRISDTSYFSMWAPNPFLVVTGGGQSYNKVVGFFEYNNLPYWITNKYNETAQTLDVIIYKGSTAGVYNSTAVLSPFTVVSYTGVTAGKSRPTIAHFIHKDRLWLVHSDKVYFSKATDPTVFTVPDGGFIGIPDVEITTAVALSDSVYIGCRRGIFVFTYSVDPNDDAYLRPIDPYVGAMHMVVHKSQVFFTDAYNLYTLNNNSVANFLRYEDHFDDLHTTSQTSITYTYKIVSFGDLLYVIPYRKTFFTGVTTEDAGVKHKSDVAVRVVNTINNTLSTLVFPEYQKFPTDGNPKSLSAIPSYITDAWVLKGTSGEDETVVFMTSWIDSATGTTIANYYTQDIEYKIKSFITGQFISGGTDDDFNGTFIIPKQISIDGYDFSGDKYAYKKVRSLLMEAFVPYDEFEVAFFFDNNSESFKKTLQNQNINNSYHLFLHKPHDPARIGVNRRCHQASLDLRTKNIFADVSGSPTRHYELEISDLRFLWTYTGRMPEKVVIT